MSINGQSVIGIIPARGGSKRIPRKNVQLYKGKPLIEWAVSAARDSKYLDGFCVSSDDAEMLEMAAKLDAEAIVRPAWLATDKAMNEGVMTHLLYTWRWADWVVLLQPTSPQRTGQDIDTCIERAQQGNGCVTYNEHGNKNGAVYVARSTYLIAGIRFTPEMLDQFLIMPNDRSLDIDYPADLG